MKKYIIIFVVLVIILFAITMKVSASSMKSEFEKNLKRLHSEYKMTKEESKILEQLFRLESNHFKSKQFLGTKSAGMEKFGSSYPYGWYTMHNEVWRNNPSLKPTGYIPFTENETGFKKYFLKFPSLYASMATVLKYSRKHDGNFSRWYSKDPKAQKIYKSRLDSIIPRLTYKIYE